MIYSPASHMDFFFQMNTIEVIFKNISSKFYNGSGLQPTDWSSKTGTHPS